MIPKCASYSLSTLSTTQLGDTSEDVIERLLAITSVDLRRGTVGFDVSGDLSVFDFLGMVSRVACVHP